MTTIRREPPRFRHARVAAVTSRSPRLTRVTLQGPDLVGLEPAGPAASVRLLLPRRGQDAVELPSWTGNEFLYADGARPPIRTLTPLRIDASDDAGVAEVDVEIVRHGDGPLSRWAESAAPGDRVAVSGTGRGYDVDPRCTSYLLIGDESALPAIATVLPALPRDAEVHVLVEVADPGARIDLPPHPGLREQWSHQERPDEPGHTLVDAVRAVDLPAGARVWAAGEAAAMQRIRRHLFEVAGVPRSHAVIRGYWKHGRAGTGDA